MLGELDILLWKWDMGILVWEERAAKFDVWQWEAPSPSLDDASVLNQRYKDNITPKKKGEKKKATITLNGMTSEDKGVKNKN